MSKEEIKEGMEKVAGGTDVTPGKKPGSGHKIIRHDEHLIRMPKMLYGAPAIRPIKPGLIDKPVITKKPEQPEQPVEPLTPAKPEDSEILK